LQSVHAMNAKALIAVATLCLLSTINAQTTINNQIYGTAATAGSSGAYVINYIQTGGAAGSGAQLSITVSAACTITLSAYLGATLNANILANSGIALPSTFLSVDVGAGYTLAISAGTATNIQLITTVGAALTALLVTNTNAGVVKVNSNNQVTAVVPSTYSTTNQKITVNLPDVGNYAVVAAKATVSLPSASTAGYYYANSTVTFDFGNNVRIGFFSRSQSTAVSQSLSSTYTQGSASAAAWAKALGAYVTVNVGGATDYTGSLFYTYTDAQVSAAGITDASKLRFAVYNTATASWQVPASGGSVDTSARVVSQSTASFSEWGVYYTGSSATKTMLSTVVVAMAMLLPLLGVSLL